MEFVCEAKTLYNAANLAQKHMTSKFGITKDVHVSWDGLSLKMRSTDFEAEASFLIAADVTATPGEAMLLDAKELAKGLRKTKGQVRITGPDAQERVTVKNCTSEFSLLHGGKADEFPAFHADFPLEAAYYELSASAIEDFKKVLPSVSDEKGRYAMNGVRIQGGIGEYVIVGTDGKRMTVATERRGEFLPIPPEWAVIVPTNVINMLVAIGKPCSVKRVAETLYFDVGSVRIFARQVEGDYPPYAEIVNDLGPSNVTATVNRKELIEALKPMVCNRFTHGVWFWFTVFPEKVLTIEQHIPDGPDHKAVLGGSIVMHTDKTAEQLKLAINPGFLLDVAKSMDTAEVTMECRGKRAMSIKDGNVLHVVMPLNL